MRPITLPYSGVFHRPSLAVLCWESVSWLGNGSYRMTPALACPMCCGTCGTPSALGWGLYPGPRLKQPCPLHSQPLICQLMADLAPLIKLLQSLFLDLAQGLPLPSSFPQGLTLRRLSFTYCLSRFCFHMCSSYLPKEMRRPLMVGIVSYFFSVSHINTHGWLTEG